MDHWNYYVLSFGNSRQPDDYYRDEPEDGENSGSSSEVGAEDDNGEVEVIIEKIFKTNMQILVFFKKASSILLILMVLLNNKINAIKNKIRIDDIHIIPM